MKLIRAIAMIAMPTILHSSDIAFFDDFFFKESLITIGTTSHITNPIKIEIISPVIN